VLDDCRLREIENKPSGNVNKSEWTAEIWDREVRVQRTRRRERDGHHDRRRVTRRRSGETICVSNGDTQSARQRRRRPGDGDKWWTTTTVSRVDTESETGRLQELRLAERQKKSPDYNES